MAGDISKLSAEAQELIDLTTSKGGMKGYRDPSIDVEALLRDRPELLKGMNEYLAWRDDQNRMIEETKTAQPLGHEVSKNIAELAKKKEKK